jgi:hypothetical protein
LNYVRRYFKHLHPVHYMLFICNRSHNDDKILGLNFTHITFIHSFIHSVVSLTTGSKPVPKWALHIVRSRASSFRCEYPLPSLRSSSSFLLLLSRHPVTSISFFLSFNNLSQKAVSTQYVTNPVSLPFAYFM